MRTNLQISSNFLACLVFSTMGLSRGEAYETLQLPFGADPDSSRTSYKRLAMKWHPDRHKNSPESIKNFLEISMAYKRLNIESDIVQMSVNDCLQLYSQTMEPPKQLYSNGYDMSDDEDDSEDDDEDEEELEYMFKNRFSIGAYNSSASTASKHLSPEEIEKNANELITEEEKEKRRAEKRRAKKKRRREKKRLEKQQAEQQKKGDDQQKKKSSKKDSGADSKSSKKTDKIIGNNSTESETDDFDQSASFFTRVVNKKKKTGAETTNNNKPKTDTSRTTPNGNEESLEDLDPVVLRSRQLAIEGNRMANVGHYQAAIDLFTEAVKLDPRDFRFFGNRSYCFDRQQQYEKALKDADKAISLAPDWPKGYFRKGRALAGLKLFADAEQAYMQVLKLDKNCEDAMQELQRVRTHQLTEMGFSQAQAQGATRQYDSVQQALDSLLAGVESSLVGEVYMSDDDDYSHSSSPQNASATAQHHHSNNIHSIDIHHASKVNDVKMNPSNPEGLTALWVGNVLPEVTEKKLQTMFSKYGMVTSVRLLPEKYCAFINFKTKEAAGLAMKNLQNGNSGLVNAGKFMKNSRTTLYIPNGVPCAGQQLLIKFPDNPVNSGPAANSVVIRKNPTGTPPAKQSLVKASAPTSTKAPVTQIDKVTGPVNGNECYFWRTTGCQFGSDCHYKHIPDHKGQDKKPWQRQDKG